MAEVNNNIEVYDWDDEFEFDEEAFEPKEYVLLKAGDYNFEVVSTEKTYHNAKPGGMLPSCPKMKLTLLVDGGDQGKAKANDFLYLCNGGKKKISGFAVSLGICSKENKNGKFKIPWSNLATMKGRAHIKPSKPRDGKQYNEVAWYLEPEDDNEESFEI